MLSVFGWDLSVIVQYPFVDAWPLLVNLCSWEMSFLRHGPVRKIRSSSPPGCQTYITRRRDHTTQSVQCGAPKRVTALTEDVWKSKSKVRVTIYIYVVEAI